METIGLGLDAVEVCAWTWETLQRLLGSDNDSSILAGRRPGCVYLHHGKYEDTLKIDRMLW